MARLGYLGLAGALVLGACGGSGDGGDGGTGTSGTGTPMTTAGPATTNVDSSTSGGPAVGGLMPCDPLDDRCEDGVCAGLAVSGFYCRAVCSSNAAVGDPCGTGGECLEASPVNSQLVCVEFDGCDPLTSGGCNPATGESCGVVAVGPLQTACVPSGNGAAGDPCDPAFELDCGVGLGCLGSDLDGMDPGLCTPWCDPGGALPQGCAQCIPFAEGIGACAQCNVLDNDCPMGQQCQPTNELLGGVCLDFGPQAEGETCDFMNLCQEGLFCLETEVDDVFECVQTCDPLDPMCDDPDKTCVDLAQVSGGVADPGVLGLCIEVDLLFCDPAGPNTCPAGQSCIDLGGGDGLCADPCDPTLGEAACAPNYACFPEQDGMFFFDPIVVGNGSCGQGCSGDGECGGGTCLLTDGLESDGVCGPTCATAAPMCAVDETCVPTPGDPAVGACIVGGAPCDPAVNDSCVVEAPNTACIALDGAAAGACMPPCFEQDPAACEGAPAMCQVRTDPQWHDGACLGADVACDPLMQDCTDAAQTCRVLGGAAFGGQAYVCDDAGPAGEGDDCSADDGLCGLGLVCLDSVCRAYCDPQNDICATGSCADISASLYLPADTIGVCQ